MARPLRIEYAEAAYHVTSRGNEMTYYMTWEGDDWKINDRQIKWKKELPLPPEMEPLAR